MSSYKDKKFGKCVMFSEKGNLEYGYLLQIFFRKLKNSFERESYACKEMGIIIEFNIIR